MSARTPSGGGGRPRRGRPQRDGETERHRTAGPTQARLLTVRLLDRAQRLRSYTDLLLHHSLALSPLSGADRALVTELVCGTLRWRGRLDYLLDHILDRSLQQLDPLVTTTLRVGAYQIVFCDRIPASAAVDESVRCARALGFEQATGLVNAVLRRLAGEHATIELPQLAEQPLEHLVHALSLPTWIAQRWLDLYGPSAAAALAHASNEPPPITVRANRKRVSADALLEEVRMRFPDARPCRWASDGIVLGHGGDPGSDPAFLEGRFTVQDEAAQLVVALLDPQPGDLLLTSILTLERDAARDLGDLPVLPGRRPDDGSGADSSRAHEAGPARFNRVLVDAPCSGLGTLRRNPDARWRARPEATRELASVQLAILEQATRVLRPGGVLVYSTCTLLPEENEHVVAAFLGNNPSYHLAPRSHLRAELAEVVDEDGLLRCLPHVHHTDGFFAARLEQAP